MTAPFLRYAHNLSESGYWFERALAPELRRFARETRDPGALALDFGCGLKPYAGFV